MTAATPSPDTPGTAPAETPGSIHGGGWGRHFSIWVRHLLSFWFPGIALTFLLTGPHSWWVALLFLVPVGLALYFDSRSRVETRQPIDVVISRIEPVALLQRMDFAERVGIEAAGVVRPHDESEGDR